MSVDKEELKHWIENIMLPYRLRQILRALLEENEHLEQLSAEKTRLWGEAEDQNRQLREELKRNKKFTKEEQQDLGHLFEDYQKECSENQQLREELERVTQRNEEKYQLLLRMKDEIDRFGILVGINMDTSLQEKAVAFNNKVESLHSELAAKDKVLEFARVGNEGG